MKSSSGKSQLLLAITFFLACSSANAFYSTTLDACIPNARTDCSNANAGVYGAEYCVPKYDGPISCEVDSGPGYICAAYEYRDTYYATDGTFIQNTKCYDSKTYDPNAAVSANYEPRTCKSLPGSIVQVDNLAVAEDVAIIGSPFHLIYQSQRVPGYSADRSLLYVLSTSDTAVTGISSTVTIAGQNLTNTFTPTGGTPVAITWNGLDSVGNPMSSARASTSISETNNLGKYDWAGGGSTVMAAALVNNEYPQAAKYSIGLWTIDQVHFLDTTTGYIHFGFGSRKAVTTFADPSTGNPSVADDDGKQVFVFNSLGQHIATKSALTGATLLTMTYLSGGRLNTITDSFGNVTTIGYDLSLHPNSITAPYGQVTSLSMNSSGYLASLTEPGSANSYLATYKTGTGLLETFTKPNGEVSTMTYTSVGKLIADSSSAGPSITLSQVLDLTQNTITSTTAGGRVTQVSLSANGSDQFFSRQETSPAGEITTQSHPQLYSSSYAKDGHSSYSSLSDDPRFGPNVQYVSGLNVTAGSSGRTESIARTAAGSLTSPYDFTSLTETKSVSSAPNSTSVFNASTGIYTYTSPSSRVSTYKINSYEQAVQTKDTSFAAINYAYDTNGRPYTITQGTRTTTLGYNTAGFLSSVTDAMSQVTSFTYDTLGRILTTTLPDTRVVTYIYDSGGNIASITPPSSSAHSFTNNVLNFVTVYQAPSLGSGTLDTLYSYNNDRQLTQITRPSSAVINFNYDATTSLLTSVVSGTATYSFTYPANDERMNTATSPDGVVSTHYYSGNLPATVEYSGSGKGLVTYTFDSALHLSAFQIGTGTTYSFLYDNDELLKKTGSETITRNTTTGRVSSTTLGSATETYSYDSTYGEISGYQAKYSTTNKINETYTRDALGRVSTRTVTIGTGSPDVYAYTYDAAGRLTEVTKNSTSIGSYTYDSNSNRTSSTNSGGTFSATYDAEDRLSTYGTKTFSYNLNGERTSQVDSSTSPTTTSYTWDAFGNLKQVTLPSSTQIKYQYDGQNRKVTKTTATTVNERYVYLDQTRLLGVLNSSGSTVMTFFYGARNTPEYMIKSGTTYKFFVDHVGSVRQVVNTSTGAVSQELTYDEFGRVLSDSSPGFQPFGFAGGLYDSATGLTQFGSRWYDAQVGRWLTKDPIGFDAHPNVNDINRFVRAVSNVKRLPIKATRLLAKMETNLYGYVMQDPINFVDPTGLSAESEGFIDRTETRAKSMCDKMNFNPVNDWKQATKFLKDTSKDARKSLFNDESTQFGDDSDK